MDLKKILINMILKKVIVVGGMVAVEEPHSFATPDVWCSDENDDSHKHDGDNVVVVVAANDVMVMCSVDDDDDNDNYDDKVHYSDDTMYP